VGMTLANAAISALLNVALLAGLPFLFYFGYHKWRKKRAFAEIARRAGLGLGERRYLIYALLASLVAVAALLIWQPPLEPFTRKGSPQRAFVGLEFPLPAIPMALLYGLVKTGLAEEFLFRGLIAGSLSRRVPDLWANLLQATIFLLPHLLILLVMPQMWALLPVVFAGALFAGWLRIRSGSILGPWLLHASVNVAMCLSVAVRTAS